MSENKKSSDHDNSNMSGNARENKDEDVGAVGGGDASDDDEENLNFLQKFMEQLKLFTNPTQETEEEKPKPEQLLEDVSLQGIANYIQSPKCKKIIVLSGAGISTAAGIPDFRSPGSGLYDNLQKFDLPSPQSIFEISYFVEKPEAFFTLAKELYPGEFKPTASHYFVKLLEKKNRLLRTYTQNIDTLERVAGISDDKIVEAHGTFHTSHCLTCRAEYTQTWMRDIIFKDEVPRCIAESCEGGLVKPDIVFFGEALPERFHTKRMEDFGQCDLLIVMGTSLKVQPFASLIDSVPDTTPRLLINREKSGSGNPVFMMLFGGGMKFDTEDNYRDVFWEGNCDDGCRALCSLLGWLEELDELVKTEQKKIDEAKAKT